MINNVVLISGVQQSDSVIHIHVSILFQILFPFRLLQNIMVLICISLVTNDVEHLFLCLFAIHLPTLMKCLFKIFTYFFWCYFFTELCKNSYM